MPIFYHIITLTRLELACPFIIALTGHDNVYEKTYYKNTLRLLSSEQPFLILSIRSW